MLVPVAQHQSRFVIPGLTADGRGVVCGKLAAAVLPSLDRVVSAIAALTEQSDLEDLYREMTINRVRSSIGSTDFMVSFPSSDTNVLDRVSTLTSIFGGELLTGDGRHMVRYRDRHSPLGYDVERLADADGDIVTYGLRIEGSHRVEERLSLRQLILQVTAMPARSLSIGKEALIACPPGLRRDLERLLWRSGAEVSVTMVEAGDESRVGSRAKSHARGAAWTSGLFLYRVTDLPAPAVRLLKECPGIGIFAPAGEYAAVEFGFVHPLALHACGSSLESFGLHLFEGGRSGALVVKKEGLEWTRLRSALATTGSASVVSLEPEPGPPESAIRPSLCRDPSVIGRPTAVFIDKKDEPLLLRMLHLLPEASIEGYRVAALGPGILIVAQEGLNALPIGRPLVPLDERILIPVGYGLRPKVSVERLAELLGGLDGRYFFFLPGEAAPLSVAETAFSPLGAAFVARLVATPETSRVLPHLPGTTRVTFDTKEGFPLWGNRSEKKESVRELEEGE